MGSSQMTDFDGVDEIRGGTDGTTIGNTGDKLNVADGADTVQTEQPYNGLTNEKAVSMSLSPQALMIFSQILSCLENHSILLTRIEQHLGMVTDSNFEEINEPFNGQN